MGIFEVIVMVIEFVGVGTVIAVLKDAKNARKERRADVERQAQELELIKDGQRCQLRSQILSIYYHSRDAKIVRQYELENAIKLYNAYKALGGNSFVDKIYKELMSYNVIT